MKKIILLLLLVSGFVNAQIEIKSDNTASLEKIKGVLDSTANINEYRTASQFLGLIGSKVYNLPPNASYASKNNLKINFRYVAKEKIKTKDGSKYNAGELVFLYYDDFYKNNVSGRYYKVTNVEFFKGRLMATPEEWQKETIYGFNLISNNVKLYLTSIDNSLDLVVNLDGIYNKDCFISDAYFEKMRKENLNKKFLLNNKYRYDIKNENYYDNFIILKPKEILDEDVFTVTNVNFLDSNSEYSEYPILKIFLKNSQNKEIVFDAKKNISPVFNPLVDFDAYQNFYDKVILRKEEKNKTIYRLFGKIQGDKITSGIVELGMSSLAVIYAKGNPDDRNVTKTKFSKSEQFVYKIGDDYKYYYFENDKLTAIQD